MSSSRLSTLGQQRLPNPYRPEDEVVRALLARLHGVLDWSQVMATAQPWVEAVRRQPTPVWNLDRLLREYPLHSSEGRALMRLAEALLRVPDPATASALLSDALGLLDTEPRPDRAVRGLSKLVRRALLQAQSFVNPGDAGQLDSIEPGWRARVVLPLARQAVRWLGQQFVLGQDLASALRLAQKRQAHHRHLYFSFDMLGEGARTAQTAQSYQDQYEQALQALARQASAAGQPHTQNGLSIKLSALHPRYEMAQRNRVLDELVPRVWRLCEGAAQAGLNLTLDAEESDRLELSLDVLEALLTRVAAQYPQWQGLGLALQAYQTRALALVEHVIALARRYRVRLMCRLVKGAYWDSEIKRAQELGARHYPVFTHKSHTDLSYLACAHALLAAPDAVYPQFATHNAATLAALLQLAGTSASAGAAPSFELQRLHGMGGGIYQALQDRLPQQPVRVYAPVGPHRDLLAYLVRRLLENGANASFVHQLADTAVPVVALLASPLRLLETPGLPLPPQLYGARPNSWGPDLNVPQELAEVSASYAQTSLIPIEPTELAALPVALGRAQQAWPVWQQQPLAHRVACLQRAADKLQARLPHYCALLVREASKTWPDAVAEVREAVDFLRYYAEQASTALVPRPLPGPTGEYNELRLLGRGVWVCISPWNFPLAIFVGQVAAALVTGNVVLAKPAEQTPLIAREAVHLLHEAGVPPNVLQLLHGPGETVGEALVALPGVAGVVFTGSVVVAKRIQRVLAAQDGPIVPLIAETGGINAMVVDATALPEQVCDAVVHSAFHSAGQRCSALRLLCVHASVADAVIDMVCGAAQQLVLGDPAHWSTDVGPLIDAPAYARVQAQIADVQQRARLVWAAPSQADRHIVGPHVLELTHLADLREEIFGPVLCCVRWGVGPLDTLQAVLAAIHQLGYGLTLGLQTRIEPRAHALAAQAQVGNVYVNRHMVGAVVGGQPFGGQGWSGTGPKAGGPHYLLRFCTEQTLTINTAAAGGNLDLLG